MIKILIVDDSPTVRELLTYIFSQDPSLFVTGTAGDGKEAVHLVRKKKPDIITMDIHLPDMDGFMATRTIMENCPTPVVIVSGYVDKKDIASSFKGIEAGALAVVRRPSGVGHPDFERESGELINTIKLMAEIKVVRRSARTKENRITQKILQTGRTRLKVPQREIDIIAIGASTGGPAILKEIVATLPGDFPPSILITQHISNGFANGFADWLGSTTGFPVRVGCHGEWIQKSTAYIPPDGHHLTLHRSGHRLACTPFTGGETTPSVDLLFESVANVSGDQAVGVLLTGMGNDGAKGLKLMKDHGAVTIVQDKESSVVFGMPLEAIKLDGALYVLSPVKIAEKLISLINNQEIHHD